MTAISTPIRLPYLGSGWVIAQDEDGDVVIRLRGSPEANPPVDPAAAIILKLDAGRDTPTPPVRGMLANVASPPSHPDCARCNAALTEQVAALQRQLVEGQCVASAVFC